MLGGLRLRSVACDAETRAGEGRGEPGSERRAPAAAPRASGTLARAPPLTQEIDSAALTGIRPALGIAGADAAQQTFLDDGNVSQVLETNPVIRRDIEIFPGNYFHGMFQNTHVVSGEQQSFIDPYVSVNQHNNFPALVPDAFDIYLMGLTAMVTSGGANVEWVGFTMDVRQVNAAFSDLNTGGPASIVNREFPLMVWVDIGEVIMTPGTAALMSDETPLAYRPMKIRWPRGGAALTLRSQVTDAATIRAVAWFGGFPRALGQDVGW